MMQQEPNFHVVDMRPQATDEIRKALQDYQNILQASAETEFNKRARAQVQRALVQLNQLVGVRV